ncbi:MAG TPA: class I SAM-dependent methyltransferase [Usitatibacter sp.]|nr:class I SAM-dependent methyltransferase [Usitatibacter sp.]
MRAAEAVVAAGASARAALVDRGGCPLCDAAAHRLEARFDAIPLHACAACGFRFSGRVMEPGRLAEYYAKGFGSERHRAGQEINAHVNRLALARLVPLARVRTALDVGSGYGFLVRRLRELGIDARGLEPSADEASWAAQNGAPTTRAALDARAEPGRFDLVTSFEVLEHALEPRRFLADAARLVAPGGWLVVMTDNFESAVVERMGTQFPKWIPHAHVSHFAPATFTRLCASLPGFALRGSLSYTPWELTIAALLHRLGRRTPPFELDRVMATEMCGTLRWPGLRRTLDPLWFRLSARDGLRGELMYAALQRAGAPC